MEKVRNSGIVGAGGAGFPTHVKLGGKPEYVIVNGAECEPLLRVDQQLLKIFRHEIIEGTREIVKATGARKGYICIKRKHGEVVEALKSLLKEDRVLELFELDDFYPAGDEQVLVHEVTGRVVPEGGIPLKVGCVVINAETVLNVYNSLSDKPVTMTYMTIAGMVPRPVTLKLPVGTPISEALKISGIDDIKSVAVINGGPMMGKTLQNLEEPVVKTTKGLVVLPKDHSLIRKKTLSPKDALRKSRAACLQCRMCTDMCPRYLLGHNMQPHLMMRKSNYSSSVEGAEMAFLCSECSVCELYACPAGLSPRLININYKRKLSEAGIKYSSKKDEFFSNKAGEYRRIPVKRLVSRLDISEYDVDAPMDFTEYHPKRVMIPLKQHIGAPALPAVSPGQIVKEGDLIGEIPANALGARVHSSIDGRVVEISDCIIIESI